jgi:hypothetical protein
VIKGLVSGIANQAINTASRATDAMLRKTTVRPKLAAMRPNSAVLNEAPIPDAVPTRPCARLNPVIRMSDVPEIHTRVVASDNPPTGVGEIGVVTVAPAIANGIYQVTGERLRHLPMSPERLKAALG